MSTTGCGCPPAGLSRRSLLRAAGIGGVLALGSTAVPMKAAFGATSVPTDTLVVLFFRGGADWLSIVPPIGDGAYYAARPTIAVPASRALPLDSTFGLHPALAPLLPFWQSGQLGFVHAAASIDPSRSHFDAQAALETGAYDDGRTHTRWLDRYLTNVPGSGTFDAVAHGTAAPQSLAGPAPTLAASSLQDFGLPTWLGQRYRESVAGQYAGVTHALARNAREAFDAMATMQRLFAGDDKPANGAKYPYGDLGDGLSDAARLVKANLGTRLVTLDYGGWDMHSDLGTAGGVDGGQMHDQLTEVGQALAAFATDLGPALANVTLVTVTEFGRRVKENDSAGLDHGHGQGMLLLGGAVRGGRVTTAWPTLAPDRLDQGDLAGTIDVRNVFGSLLHARMGASDAAVRRVFPGLRPSYLDLVAPR